jgi:hypothetical protein
VQGSFKSIKEASSKDGVIRIEHVNNIKGDVFGARVLWGSKGNRQSYDPYWFNSFPAEVEEGLDRLF